jgi:hypothetical protein
MGRDNPHPLRQETSAQLVPRLSRVAGSFNQWPTSVGLRIQTDLRPPHRSPTQLEAKTSRKQKRITKKLSYRVSGAIIVFSLSTAEARVGRPLTATSVAGVSRRVQRREYRRTAAGVAVGAAVGAAAVGAAAAPPPPAPVPVGPAVAGPAPVVGPGYGYGPGPYPDAVIVNPVTGRWCRTEPSGYQFCWTP